MSNTSLVFMSEDQSIPVTTSEVIATALDKEHKDVLALAKKYEADLNEFGTGSFETKLLKTNKGNGATQTKEIAILNEQQATLLITYMRNSDKVRKFKIALVKAFFEMREKIQQRKVQKELSEARKELKDFWYQKGQKEAWDKKATSTKESLGLVYITKDSDFERAYEILKWHNDHREEYKKIYEELKKNEEAISRAKYALGALSEIYTLYLPRAMKCLEGRPAGEIIKQLESL